MTTAPRREILGVPFLPLTTAQALDEVERLYQDDSPAVIAHANAHTVNLAVADEDYRDVLRRATVVFNDGKGVMLAARILGWRFPADLNGNHMGPLLLERAAQRSWPIFFYGGRPGVAETAAERLRRRIPGLDIVGIEHGYGPEGPEEICARIRSSGAGLVYVALGNPAQERWLDAHLGATGASVGVGVGAFFDFIADAVPRAPLWMNRVGLEWLFRLAQEPRRMWRRYMVGNPLFIARVLQQRRTEARLPGSLGAP